MNIEQHKQYIGTPFSVVCKPIKNNPGEWNSSKVSIYRDYEIIGEYIRNYPDYAVSTFEPFLIGKVWYALYSPNYTALRVMRLDVDSVEDWCGEAPSATGFCPVEVFVPQYMKFDFVDTYYLHNTEYKNHLEFMKEKSDPAFIEHTFHNFGFLSGCHWGDESSWKLRHIDLSKVSEKELIITEKYGYWELPENTELKDCITLRYWEDGFVKISGTKMVSV